MGSVEVRLASAFKLACETAFANTGEVLEPHEIVFEALREAMETLKGLPDQEAGWLYSQGFWPQIVHDHEDVIDNYKEMLRRIASGEEGPEALLGKRRPSSSAIDRMDVVFQVFPQCLVGKQRSRDWKILCFSGMGQSMRVIARLAKCGLGTVADRKDVQTRQIATKLAHLMPTIPGSGIVAPSRLLNPLEWA